MNAKPLNQANKELIKRLQDQLNEARRGMNVSASGIVLFRAELSYADDEVAIVEADGFGGAVLLIVEGNYPVDYNIRDKRHFPTEAEAVRAAEALRIELAH